MSECSAMRESMPLLLTESLDPVRREVAHQHIESCGSCGDEWSAYQETWLILDELPQVEVPSAVRERFLMQAGIAPERAETNVVPFHRRPAVRWVAQAAAVTLLVGGGYFFGDRNAERITPTRATIDAVTPIQQTAATIAETRVLSAESLSPTIEGRPNIANVQFVDMDSRDDVIAVAFDVTSRWTVTGNPKETSMVRLLSYMLENESAVTPRSNALEWVRRTYADPAYANPEIANALAKVLRTDAHQGVRLRAVETLTTLPPAVASDTRTALIDALRSDPNPAVRLKAVEALANMARSGAILDPAMVDTLRQKASQDDENLYVRVKAAEALSSIR